MKHKLYTRLLSLALAVGLVIGMLPSAAAVDTVGDAGQPVTLGNGDQVSFDLSVKLFSTNGVDLTSNREITIPVKNGEEVPVPGNYANDIQKIEEEGNTYQYKYVSDSLNGGAITSLQAGEVSHSTQEREIRKYWVGGSRKRDVERTVTTTYGVWAGTKPNNAAGTIAYKTQVETYTVTQTYWVSPADGWTDDKGSQSDSTFSPVSEQVNNKTVYFMYEKQGTADTDRELTRDKFVTDNGDGTYDLTLTVSGAAGSITNKQKLDVLFIVDQSGSMDYSMSDKDRTSRIAAVRTAISQITNGLSGSETLDVRYSMVTFSGSDSYWDESYNDASVKQGWTDSAQTINRAADSIDPDGGTNYQAGIYEARTELLESARPDAMTAVIFLSDGMPTFYYADGETDKYWSFGWHLYDEGITLGSGSEYEEQGLIRAKNEAAKLTTDFFYTVGVGDENNMETYMKELANGATQVETTGYYSGTDSNSLNSIFDEIEGGITSLLCTNVTITDTLSQNVEIVTSGEGVPTGSDFKITITDDDGSIIQESNNGVLAVAGGEIKAHYDTKKCQIVLDFPDDYQLVKGYTYKVTTTIQPTETAYEAYRNLENSYPDTGDEGTGNTSAGQKGFFANNYATVDYTYNEKHETSLYPKPVIQLNPGTLIITKQITGDLTEDQLAALKKSIKFDVVLNGASTSYPLSGFTESDDNFYTMSIRGLSPDTKYTVTETGADFPGYVLEANTTGTTGTIAKGGTATAVFTNKYTPDTGSLTITKTVVGLDSTALAELKDELTFAVTGPDGYNNEIKFSDEGWTSTDNRTFTYTLKDVPTGTYTVTESGHNDITNYIWQTGETTATGTVVYNAAGTPAALTYTYTLADGYLTIQKEISGTSFGDGRDTFNFKVTATSGKDEGKVWYFTIKGAGETEAIKLPVGEYKVKELSNINYACETSETIVTINNSNTEANPATVTFTNKPSKTKIPTDSGGVKNVAEIKEGQITWKQEPENDKKPTPEPTHE